MDKVSLHLKAVERPCVCLCVFITPSREGFLFLAARGLNCFAHCRVFETRGSELVLTQSSLFIRLYQSRQDKEHELDQVRISGRSQSQVIPCTAVYAAEVKCLLSCVV